MVTLFWGSLAEQIAQLQVCLLPMCFFEETLFFSLIIFYQLVLPKTANSVHYQQIQQQITQLQQQQHMLLLLQEANASTTGGGSLCFVSIVGDIIVHLVYPFLR
jgi:hypothetical protein